MNGAEDEEANKRRKLLQEALELDKDDDDEEEDKTGNASKSATSDVDEQKFVSHLSQKSALTIRSDEEESEDEEEEEDDTDELLRELEKIKRERAEEKARQEREQSAAQAAVREIEIATSNPLLNLAAALGQTPGINTTVPGTFSVKRRWDDGTTAPYSRSFCSTCPCCRPYFQEPGNEPEKGRVWSVRQRPAAHRIPQVCHFLNDMELLTFLP